MADPSGLAKTAFINNLLLVKALSTTKPPQERARAKHWADVLSMETATGEEFATRNEYLWYLLMKLEYGNLDSPPFDKLPPPGRLRPLSTVIDPETYQQILNGTHNEIYFTDTFGALTTEKMRKSAHGRSTFHSNANTTFEPKGHSTSVAEDDGKKETDKKDKPHKQHPQGDYAPVDFLGNQPRPNQGAFCYGGVFSDYVKDEVNDKQRRD